MSGRRIEPKELRETDRQITNYGRERERERKSCGLWSFSQSVVFRAERRRLRRENRELHKTKNTEQNVEHVEDSKAYSRVERKRVYAGNMERTKRHFGKGIPSVDEKGERESTHHPDVE